MIVAILAGGKSRRMGRDKAALELNGVSLLERVCSAAFHLNLPVVVVGRDETHLPESIQARITIIPDEGPPCGPLGGLATALRHASGSSVLICATDLPGIKPESFQWLAGQTSPDTILYDGVVPTWDQRVEPLFAVYHPSVLPLVETHIAERQFAMHDLVEAGQFKLVALPEQNIDAISDVDTPEDLAMLRTFNRGESHPSE